MSKSLRSLILAIGILAFHGKSLASDFFEDDNLSAEEKATIEGNIESATKALESLEWFELMFAYDQMQKGDCDGYLDVESKARSGVAKFQYLLATLYHEGLCTEKNDQKALVFLRKAADQGFARAQYDLGVYYLQGIGTDANTTASAQWFEKAANGGDTDAQYALASLYAKGQGVAQNYKKAKSLYEKAAVGGNDQAAAELSLALAKGELGQSDPQGALRWALVVRKSR